MYSVEPRPSRIRAAPAKNRTWSIMGPISSLIVRPLGLPVFSHSISTSRSALSSIAVAIFSR